MGGMDEEGGAGRTMTVARHEGGFGFGRIALIVSALIALAAVTIAIWKRPGAAPSAAMPSTAAADQPAGGDIGQRLAELEKSARAAPNDAEAWRRLGWAYYGTGQFPKSADAYTRAATIDPHNADTWSALGEALVYTGTADQPLKPEAVAAFRKARAIDGADPRARYFLAVERDLKGDHKGAIDDWITLLKDSPPGAPWSASVRQTIERAAAKYKIEVADRLPPPDAAPASAATDAIPGPTREQMAAAASIPPGQQDAMVRGMIDGLAARLRANPKDATGWLRLMRAHMVLGEQAKARQALADGRAAFPGDAAIQAQLSEGAKALGVPGA